MLYCQVKSSQNRLIELESFYSLVQLNDFDTADTATTEFITWELILFVNAIISFNICFYTASGGIKLPSFFAWSLAQKGCSPL